MALNYVTLVLDEYYGDSSSDPIQTGVIRFTPSALLTDPTDHEVIPQAPVQVVLSPAGTLPASVTLLATDNANLSPSGWAWTVTFLGVPGNPASFSFSLPYNGGATQYLSGVQQVQNPATMQAYMPLQLGKCLAQSGRMYGMGYMGAVADYYTCSLAAATWSSQTLFVSRIDCAAALAAVNGYVSLQWYAQNAGLANAYIGLYNSSGAQLGATANLASQSNGTWIRVPVTGFTQTPADGIVFAVYANGTQAAGAGPGALGFGFYDVPIPYSAYPPGAPTAGPLHVAYGGSYLYPNPSGNTLPSTLPSTGWAVTNVLPFMAID